MRIVLASSEAVPFSKTGGLADVASALPKALALAGHDVWLFTPYYPQVVNRQRSELPAIVSAGLDLTIGLGSKLIRGHVLESSLPGSNVKVYLIDQPGYFDRAGLYQDAHGDFGDNAERYIFFCRAALETARRLELRPDIVHANDWQTALLPALLPIEYRVVPGFEETA